MIPIRGQIVRATAPRVTSVYLAELGQWSCYAIPRGDCVVFGGTHEEGEWDEAPDETLEPLAHAYGEYLMRLFADRTSSRAAAATALRREGA